MKLYDDKTPTISTVIAKDKNGKAKTDADGNVMGKLSFSFNWKSALASFAFLLFVGRAGAFYFQTIDTTKAVKRLRSTVDTLQNKVITEQLANGQKMNLILTLLDPENGMAKIEKIEADKDKLLKELEAKKNEKGS